MFEAKCVLFKYQTCWLFSFHINLAYLILLLTQVSIQIDVKLTLYFCFSLSLSLFYGNFNCVSCETKGFFVVVVFFFSCSGSVWRRQFDHNELMQATFLGLPGHKPGLCVFVYTCVSFASLYSSPPSPTCECPHHCSKTVSRVAVFCLFDQWLNVDYAGMNSNELAPKSSLAIPRRLLKELKAFALDWISSNISYNRWQ